MKMNLFLRTNFITLDMILFATLCMFLISDQDSIMSYQDIKCTQSTRVYFDISLAGSPLLGASYALNLPTLTACLHATHCLLELES